MFVAKMVQDGCINVDHEIPVCSCIFPAALFLMGFQKESNCLWKKNPEEKLLQWRILPHRPPIPYNSCI